MTDLSLLRTKSWEAITKDDSFSGEIGSLPSIPSIFCVCPMSLHYTVVITAQSLVPAMPNQDAQMVSQP